MCFFMLFFKMPMQVLFQIKFPQNRCLVTSWEYTGIHHIGAPDDLIVFIVFQGLIACRVEDLH